MDTNIKSLLKRKERASIFDAAKQYTDNSRQTDIQEMINRRNNAQADLNMWRSILETAYHYTVPNYNPWINVGRGGAIAPGQVLNADIYDLTLPIAHIKLTNKMLTGMVPQGQQWVKYVPGMTFGDPAGRLYRQAAAATQKFTDQFFNILDRSNFYLAAGESMSDTLISTGIMVVNEGTREDPLVFEAVPVSYVALESDPRGSICAVFRDWIDIKVSYIKTLWPRATLPPNKQMDAKVTIYECSYIDHEATKDKRYKYCILTADKEILLEESSASWPWVIYRMRKLTGETRGRGPSLDAYPTAATINEALGDELMAAAFTANPMYMAASDSTFNNSNFRAQPGNIIPVQMIMGEWPIQPFPGGGNINFSAMVISDLRQQINELLFAAPLGPVSSPDKTATEAQIRYTENLESFSAFIPRLQREFFDPLISRCLFVLSKVRPEIFGDMEPDVRDRLVSVDGEILDLKYETPLMTARGQVKAQALLGYYNALASMVGPEAATATLKPAKLVQTVAQYSGADLDVIKDEDEINQELEAAANAAQDMMANQGVDIEPNI